MPTSDPEVWRRNGRAFYERNREAEIERAKRRREDLREWFMALKRRPCEWCGHEGHPGAMHFHHRDPDEKEFMISGAYRKIGRPRILAEIEKCDLICADCHAAVHDLC